MPDWYKDVQAARYAGVPLAAWYDMPLYYQSRYIGAINAENQADQELRRAEKARAAR